jgi:2-oxoglutarate dehydrogenase E1 component
MFRGIVPWYIRQKPLLNRWRFYSSANDTFLQGVAANYIDAMQNAWKADPKSVHVSWQVYFANLNSGSVDPKSAFIPPPTLFNFQGAGGQGTQFQPQVAANISNESLHKEILDHMKVQLLVRAYQVRGHHRANLDPLGILSPDLNYSAAPELDISHYNFTESDLSRQFYLGQGILHGFRSENTQTLTLREIVTKLKETYCANIGFEYCHIPDRGPCDWIRSKIEIPVKFKYDVKEKWVIFDRLLWSDSFERFIQSKYPGEKRFGLEGCEALIPGMKALIDRSVDYGVDEIVIGMPHRGRLNVLSNVIRKPNESIFCEFNGKYEPNPIEGSGDVKYHLGMNYLRSTPSGKSVHLSLVANPSHLEAVDPVVCGKVRALQFYKKDEPAREKVMGILLHGDAAFAAQGVVYETIGLHDLPSYTTGGTIHIIVNNQIGFTTDPRFARSTPYCSDIAKSINAPILHVNGDDVESVVFACQFASDWRKKYKKDIVIDIVCYRRHGHNEFDEPMFTQPRMYKAIHKQKRVLEKYIDQLLNEKIFPKEKIEENKKNVWAVLEASYEKGKTYEPTSREWIASTW